MALGKKSEVIEVDYNDLDDLITKTYGKQYECVAYEEWCNDESHTISVKHAELDAHQQEQIKQWETGSSRAGRFILGIFMQDMCNKGLIEAGEYLIKVSW